MWCLPYRCVVFCDTRCDSWSWSCRRNRRSGIQCWLSRPWRCGWVSVYIGNMVIATHMPLYWIALHTWNHPVKAACSVIQVMISCVVNVKCSLKAATMVTHMLLYAMEGKMSQFASSRNMCKLMMVAPDSYTRSLKPLKPNTQVLSCVLVPLCFQPCMVQTFLQLHVLLF